MKKSQLVMVWLLPVIIIGGLFIPYLGYLMVGMMAVLLVIAVFRGRYWCWNLCPRGAFLDLAVKPYCQQKPIPHLFAKLWFRWVFFVVFMVVLVWRISAAKGNWAMIGHVFVSVCTKTTLIAILLAALSSHRCWCVICPMGLAQEMLGKLKRGKKT